MPVSHLGLTVSHIPTATSFYLAALGPLGYRYIGTQGDSIGLGIVEADFFLCQEPTGSRVSPTHIAFTAEDRLAVRDCYTAALNAGGSPSGAPSLRNSDCSCFNAAVSDPDGNTIEFTFREKAQACSRDDHGQANTASDTPTRITAWQKNIAPDANLEDIGESIISRISKAKSRAHTVMDIAATPPRSMKQSKSGTVTPDQSAGKTIIGTFIGAAAGAAFAYAMCTSEQDSTKDDSAYFRRPTQRRTTSGRRASSAAPLRSIRSGESAYDSQRPTRRIEPPRYDDAELQEILGRYSRAHNSRPDMPNRSHTSDEIAYEHSRATVQGIKTVPSPQQSNRAPAPTPTRAATMPEDIPRSVMSRALGRRSSDEEHNRLKRHDSAMSVHSHRTRPSDDGPRSTAPSEPLRRPPSYQQSSKTPPSKAESLATIPNPNQSSPRYSPAPSIPLPSSSAIYAEGPTSRSYVPSPSAAQVPLPRSRPESYVSARDLAAGPGSIQLPYRSAKDAIASSSSPRVPISYHTARNSPSIIGGGLVADPADVNNGYDNDGDSDDGLGDMRTIVPDDSISCVDYSATPRRRIPTHRSSSRRVEEKRSQQTTTTTTKSVKSGKESRRR